LPRKLCRQTITDSAISDKFTRLSLTKLRANETLFIVDQDQNMTIAEAIALRGLDCFRLT